MANSDKTKNKTQFRKHYKKGIFFHKKSDFINAIKHLNKALEYNNQNSELFMLLADSLFKIGNKQTAIELMVHALEANPNDPKNALVLGNAAYNMGMFDLASKFHSHYIRLSPNDLIGYNNYATALREEGKFDEAIEMLQGILPQFPKSEELWNTLGSIVSFKEGKGKAIVFFEESLKINPKNHQTLNNIAPAYYSVGDTINAEKAAREAIKYFPKMKDAHLFLSNLLIAQKDFKEGWEEYQWRHDQKIKTTIKLNNIPYWQGEPLKGKKIFIFGEQGIGDEILFSWHFNKTIEEADAVGLACERRLVPLFKSSFPKAKVAMFETKQHLKLDTIFRTFPDFDLKEYDYQCAACDLTRHYWKSYEDVINVTPNINPNPDLVSKWKNEIDKLPHDISIGIAWRSGIQLANRARNYASILDWAPFLKQKNINFVNVQYGDCSAELEEIEKKHGIKIHNFDGLDLKDDFEGTTAMMKSLDLVMGPGSAPIMQSTFVGMESWFFTIGVPWWCFGDLRPKWAQNALIFPKNDNVLWADYMKEHEPQFINWIKDKRKEKK